MTAKDEILALLGEIPDSLTVDETIERIRSSYVAKIRGTEEAKDDSETHNLEKPTPDGVAPPLDGQEIKARIIEIAEELPDNLTSAETVCHAADRLRLFFLIQKDFEDIREGRTLPFEERDDEPVFLDEVPEIGTISGQVFEGMSIKGKLVHTMKRLPDDLTLSQALIEALERLLLMYKLDRSFEQRRNGQGVPHDEAKRILQERWRK